MASVMDELVAQRDSLRSEIEDLRASVDDFSETPSDDLRERWNQLNTDLDAIEENIKIRQAMIDRVAELGSAGKNERGAHFNTPKSRTENPYDLSTVERSFGNPEVAGRDLRERGKRILEGASFPHGVDRQAAQDHVVRLADKLDGADGAFSQYLIATDNPTYKRAFTKIGATFGQAMLTREEQLAIGQVQAAERALSLTTNAGGFAVPFTLDPTIIPTSNFSVNPMREISRVEQIVTDEWNGVSSAGVTASWDAEAAEVSDDAPTLAQPNVPVHKAAVFVPYSIEVGMDWAGLQSEMARAIQDSKDDLEATGFVTGTGSGQPQGVVTGATATVAAATGGAFAAADVFALEEALPPRFRPMASYVMNRAYANRIRRFDTQGGAQLWIDNLRQGLTNEVPTPGRLGSSLLGYGAYESSAMVSTTATTGAGKVLLIGDFRYYLIADRIGLQLELIPHLFHTSNNRPSGSRGIYAFWRTGGGVLSTNAFRALQL